MRYSIYQRYKRSGVGWLGDIPEHWRVVSLRWVCKRYAGGTPDKTDDSFWNEGTIPWINSGAVNQTLITEPSAYITAEGFARSSAKWIPAGALVMALAGQGKTKGMVAQLGMATTCNQSMAAIVPDQRVNAHFLFWWLSAHYYTIRNLAGGEQRDGLNLDILGALPLPLLAWSEQLAIANFLDHRTTEIDALVDKKNALIETLKEKRSALISRTVTRGLPPKVARAAGFVPNPKMKPSGIEWLGDVPEYWKVVQLKRALASSEYGISDSLSPTGSVRVLTMGNIEDGKVTIPENGFVDEVIPEMLLHNGDLLFNRTNSLAHVGKVGLCSKLPGEPLTFASYLVRLRANRLAAPKFLNYLLNTQELLGFVRSLALPSINQANLNPTRYSQVQVPLPPLVEQQAIADFLDRETAKIDALVANVEQAIERLQEYRTALITAAVTGKIDVRQEQSGLSGPSGRDGQHRREKAGSGPARKSVHA